MPIEPYDSRVLSYEIDSSEIVFSEMGRKNKVEKLSLNNINEHKLSL